MNYTRPNDPNHIDEPKDWLNASLIFTMAISNLLEDMTGIVVDIKGDSFNPIGYSKKVIVIKRNDQVIIDDFQQDLPEGTICEIVDE